MIGADLSAGWLAPLRRAAATRAPMKWADVAPFILHGYGSECSAARDGLAFQPLIVTDPMRIVRRLDLSVASKGTLAIPHAHYLFLKTAAESVDSLSLRASLQMRDVIRQYVIERTVDSSGIGLLCDHMATADSQDIDGSSRLRQAASSNLTSSLIDPLGGSINKVAKLASKASALAIPIIDPDSPGTDRIRRRTEEYAEVSHFSSMDFIVSQEALDVIAQRRMVVDRGHQDVTDLTARLRDMAEVHARGAYFDREQAYTALRETRTETAFEGRGFVREGDDRRDLLLQVADVAAGWARTIIGMQGYRQLAAVFRCVMYNGELMTGDLAKRLDEEILDHRRLVASFTKRS